MITSGITLCLCANEAEVGVGEGIGRCREVGGGAEGKEPETVMGLARWTNRTAASAGRTAADGGGDGVTSPVVQVGRCRATAPGPYVTGFSRVQVFPSPGFDCDIQVLHNSSGNANTAIDFCTWIISCSGNSARVSNEFILTVTP